MIWLVLIGLFFIWCELHEARTEACRPVLPYRADVPDMFDDDEYQ